MALRSRPGGYALLLGAGVSRSAGVVSAWEVLEDLICKIAAAIGDEIPADPIDWWHEKQGKVPDYSAVLEEVAQSQEERRAVLAPYFERTDADRAEGKKAPSQAHHAIAHLVSSGLVRVILTTNFDLLLEEALRDEGVDPVVASTPAAIASLEPLHTQGCVVVHLNGDYLDAGVLNTAAELNDYPAIAERLVRQVFDEYGLIIVGWSATWDTALAELLQATDVKRYSSWWVEPAEMNERQVALVAARSAEVVLGTADAVLIKVADACRALADVEARSSPITVAAATAAAKRELAEPGPALRTHDRLRTELDRLASCETVMPATFNGDAAELERRTEALISSSSVALALVATLAYWGDETTDRWWFDSIERLAHRPHAGGTTSLIDLSRSGATLLVYAAGVAATASERWGLVTRLLAEPLTESSTGGGILPVALALHPGKTGMPGGAEQIYRVLHPLFTVAGGFDSGTFLDSWERFEFLHHLAWAAAINRGFEGLHGGMLGWEPRLRVEGIGPVEGRATPDLWFGNVVLRGEHALIPSWLPLKNAENARLAFSREFSTYAKGMDDGLLPAGGGFLPSGRHFPGSYGESLPEPRQFT